jgi:hypothetical protein
MNMAKCAAVAVSGLVFAGATALEMSAATSATATIKAAVLADADNGGGGGGGGGTIYNPFQIYSPIVIIR